MTVLTNIRKPKLFNSGTSEQLTDDVDTLKGLIIMPQRYENEEKG